MRIGLIGWALPSGVGHMNADMYSTGRISRWLIPRHHDVYRWGVDGVDASLVPEGCTVVRGDSSAEPELRQFLDNVDAVVFVQEPQTSWPLVQACRKRGIVTCCIPMLEWLPNWLSEWMPQVDLMWAPNKWAAGQLRERASLCEENGVTCRWRVVGGRWGVDTERFQFKQRAKAERFLFVNGNGGFDGRKGWRYVVEVARMLPNLRFVVRSQVPLSGLPANCKLEREAGRYTLYDAGDVLLCPSRWEGLGMQLYEAQSCGMPVISTDAPPMNEAGRVAALPCERGWLSLCGSQVDAWSVDVPAFAGVLERIADSDISESSQSAREHIEWNHSLSGVVAELCETIARHVS